MKRYFLTGGCGFIGSWVARKLIDQGQSVFCYDACLDYRRVPRPLFERTLQLRKSWFEGKAEIAEASTSDRPRLAEALDQFQPDQIIHLASNPLADRATIERDDIVQPLNELLESADVCRRLERITYISSSMVYGHFQNQLAEENHSCQPLEPYGLLKLKGELILREYCHHKGIESVVIRPSAVYGPGDSNGRVVQKMILEALEDRTLQVKGKDEKFDFTWVGDLADGIVASSLCRKAAGEVFNLSSGSARTLADLIDILRREVPDLRCEFLERENHRPVRGQQSIKKASSYFDFQPEMTFEEGVPTCLNSIKDLLSLRSRQGQLS